MIDSIKQAGLENGLTENAAEIAEITHKVLQDLLSNIHENEGVSGDKEYIDVRTNWRGRRYHEQEVRQKQTGIGIFINSPVHEYGETLVYKLLQSLKREGLNIDYAINIVGEGRCRIEFEPSADFTDAEVAKFKEDLDVALAEVKSLPEIVRDQEKRIGRAVEVLLNQLSSTHHLKFGVYTSHGFYSQQRPALREFVETVDAQLVEQVLAEMATATSLATSPATPAGVVQQDDHKKEVDL
jgi:hypothetical protein